MSPRGAPIAGGAINLPEIIHVAEVLPAPSSRAARDAAAWLASLTPRTRAAYGYSLRAFGRYLGKKSLVEVDRADVVAWRERLVGAGASPATANLRVAAVRSFFHWLSDPGQHDGVPPLSRNPAVGIRALPKRHVRRARVPSLEELRRVVGHLAGLKPHHRLLLAFHVYTPLRKAEVLGLHLADLEEREGSAWCRIVTKGAKERLLRLPAPLYAHVLAVHPLPWSLPDRVVKMAYSSVARALHVALRACEVDPTGLHPHAFRHAWAREHQGMGMGTTMIQEALGHGEVRTTHEYLGRQVGWTDPLEAEYAQKLMPADAPEPVQREGE